MERVQYAEERLPQSPISITVGSVMPATLPANFPKINLVAIVAGALAAISIVLPWWGISASFFGLTFSINWGLWGTPNLGFGTSPSLDQIAQNMGIINAITVAMAATTAAVALLGSFAKKRGFLMVGLATGVGGLVAYAVGLTYGLSKTCSSGNMTGTCPTTPIGSMSQSGVTLSWGFQSGFYLLAAATVVVIVAIASHRIFMRQTIAGAQSAQAVQPVGVPSIGVQRVSMQTIRFCPNCANAVEPGAKFCSNCASALPS